jgi:kynurenine formamidase
VGVFSRAAILAVIVAGLLALLPEGAHRDTALNNIPSGKTRVLDLSYSISDKVVPWPGDKDSFEVKVNATVEKNGYYTRSFRMLEHFGTHLDAPIHFPPGKTTVDQIPTKQLFGPAVVLDVRPDAAKDDDYLLAPTRVEEWEKKYGTIPAGAIVLLRTGWSSRWPDVQRYRNQDAQGKMHFPGFSVEAVKLLIDRKVSGLGCDTLSADYGASTDFSVHRLSLGAGLYHLENLADLSEVPDSGAFLVVAPIKLEGGSGGPVRVFAILE